MATVKILYVRNLMLPTTEETIEIEFNSIKPGELTKSLFNILVSGYASGHSFRASLILPFLYHMPGENHKHEHLEK